MRFHTFTAGSAALLTLSLHCAPGVTAQEAAQEALAAASQGTPVQVAPAPGALFRMSTEGTPSKAAMAWSLIKMVQQPDFAEILEEFGEDAMARAEALEELGAELQELRGDDDGRSDPGNPFADMPEEMKKLDQLGTALQMRLMNRPLEQQLEMSLPTMDVAVYVQGDDEDEPEFEVVVMLSMSATTKAVYRQELMEAGLESDLDLEQMLTDAPSMQSPFGMRAVDIIPDFLRKEMPPEQREAMSARFMENETQVILVAGNTKDPMARVIPRSAAAPETTGGSAIGNNGGYRMSLDLERMLTLPPFQDEKDMASKEAATVMRMLGIDGIDVIDLVMMFGSDGMRTELQAETKDAFGGLLGCLIADSGAHPVVPMEGESGMLHTSWAIDLNAATTVVDGFADEMEKAAETRMDKMRREMGISEEDWKRRMGDRDDQEDNGPFNRKTWDMVRAALNGRMGLGIAAPLMGQTVPRIGMAWGITDADAYDKAVAHLEEVLEGIQFVRSDYEGYSWTRVVIPNAPAALVPSFARVGEMVYLADKPNTLWTMLDMVKADNVTHGIGMQDAPRSLTGGDANAMRITYDTGRMLKVMQETFMPMARLMMGMGMSELGVNMDDLFSPDELPELEEWLPYMGVGSGGIRIDGNTIQIGSCSTMGGPLMASLGTFAAPLMPTLVDLGMLMGSREIENQLTAAKAEAIADAVNAWKQSFGGGERLPPDLGAVLARGLISDESILVAPGDTRADAIEFENEDGEIEELDCSFRYVEHDRVKVRARSLYFEDTLNMMDWPGDRENYVILLYEARDTGRGRIVVTRDGTIALLNRQAFRELLGVR